MWNKTLAVQFLKYCLVGGIAFLTDFAALSLSYQILRDAPYGLYVSTAIGFLVGIIVNYGIARKMVFADVESRSASVATEILQYTIIGLIGLVFTEIGMHIGVTLLHGEYYFIKIIVATAVLLWNFLARRFWVYR